ncbi:NAD-dependent dehydratase [Prolixibacter bellariivorans]|uniref:NAD-dependent dehydratase n=2 Tax=Prolixibacter bellariivorans TaxID=314319 RepID=A0A5M4B0X5_9BACT|nr:NAD-dependent dehydratase [Prolixibacter bellariivorans]
MTMQTILGAGGAIGIDLAKELLAYTDKIRLVSRNPVKVNAGDELFPADLTNAESIDEAVKGSEVVYLVVGFPYDIKVWRKVWPQVMNDVIAACKKHNAKLVFFDNVYMYDRDSLGYMTEETSIRPTSKKGEIRRQIAQTLQEETASGELTALIARSADFLGLTNSVPVEMVYKNLAKGKKAQWLANANKVHQYTFVPDAAKATAMLGNTPDVWNQVWHLPTDHSRLTGKDWITLFAKAMNVEPKFTVVPNWMLGIIGLFVPIMRELKEMNYQNDRDYVFDSSKFEERFDFTPTQPEDAVKYVVEKLNESAS